MAIGIPRGRTDEIIDKISATLHAYERDHPEAKIDLYRQNSVSVRVRIVDPSFAGQSRSDRSRVAWKYLDRLDDEVLGDVSTVLLLAPDELEKSFSNMEFEDPVPSGL